MAARLTPLCIAVGIAALAASKLIPGSSELASVPLPGNESARWATVATDVLNARVAPGNDSEIVGSLVAGDRVEVIGDAEAGFVPVAHGETPVWLAERYLAYRGDVETFPVGSLPVEQGAAAEPWDASALDDSATVSGHAGLEADAPVEETLARAVDPPERWIDIDRSEASVTLFDGDVAVETFVGRIGRDPSPDGFYSTAIGSYRVYSMNRGLAPSPFADDTWLTDWVGFDPERSNGIHSPVRDANGVEKAWQNPTTMGCVRLGAEAAATVFDFAEIGMRVEVHE